MIKQDRRVFLKIGTVAGCTVLSMLQSGGVIAQWSINDIESSEAVDAFTDLLDGSGAETTELLRLEVPAKTENEALVPVSVQHELQDLESLTLLVDAADPVAASFTFEAGRSEEGATRRISTRLRLVEPTRIWVLANAGGRRYVSHAPVQFQPFKCGV